MADISIYFEQQSNKKFEEKLQRAIEYRMYENTTTEDIVKILRNFSDDIYASSKYVDKFYNSSIVLDWVDDSNLLDEYNAIIERICRHTGIFFEEEANAIRAIDDDTLAFYYDSECIAKMSLNDIIERARCYYAMSSFFYVNYSASSPQMSREMFKFGRGFDCLSKLATDFFSQRADVFRLYAVVMKELLNRKADARIA